MDQNSSWLQQKLADLHSLLEETSDVEGRIRLLDELSFYSLRVSVSDAERFARKEMRLAKDWGNAHWIMRSSIRLANVYDTRSEFRRARQYLRQAMKLLELEPDNHAERSYVCRYLARNSQETGDTLGTLRMLYTALDYAEKSGDRREIVASCGAIGETAFEQGNYADALDYTYRALTLFEELQAEDDYAINGIAHVRLFLGRLHLKLDDDEGAARHFQIAQNLIAKTGDVSGQALLYRGMGSVALQRERYAEALEEYEKALALSEERGAYFRDAEALLEIGIVYVAMGNASVAREMYDKAEKLFQDSGDRVGAATVRIEKARILSERKEWVAVKDLLTDVVEVLDDAGILPVQRQAHRMLARALEECGELRASLGHYKRFMELERQLTDSRVRQKLMAFEQHDRMQRAARQRAAEKRKKEKLMQDTLARSKELAKESLRLAKTDEFLKQLRGRIADLPFRNGHTQEMVRGIIRDIDSNGEHLQAWQAFEQGLDQFDPDFLRVLTTRCPDLTSAELRICSLLRMRISNREITDLLCISGRTVDTHRARIRRKLGLKKDQDLAEYIGGLHT